MTLALLTIDLADGSILKGKVRQKCDNLRKLGGTLQTDVPIFTTVLDVSVHP